MIRNNGISFGWQLPGITIISGIILLCLYWWWRKEKSWPILLIIGGGLLNFGERILFGYVNDYWRIPGTNLYNNFNDWLIFFGVVLYIWKKLK